MYRRDTNMREAVPADQLRERQREYQRRYYQQHRSQRLEYKRQWYRKHRDAILAQHCNTGRSDSNQNST